jgi:LytS/YehU family sensor histidine kinase
VDIDIDSALLDCAVPQLVLQPLVENVIRHGIGRKPGRDSIRIRAFEAFGLLHIEIQNDNSSLEQTSDPPGHVGIGLSNTALRLKTLYDDRCSLDLRSLLPSGVAVAITLPERRLESIEHEPQEVGVG